MENVSKSTLMDPNQSQLRQLVLENAKRIDKQEVNLEEMRVENTGLSKEMREQYEWLRNFREELDQSMRCSRERMDRLERFSETSRLEHEKHIYELKKLIKENSDQARERDERFDREMKDKDEKFEKEMKDRDEKFAKEMKERDVKFEKEMKERDVKFEKEMKDRDVKFEKEMKERDEKFEKEMKERDVKFEKEMKEKDEKFEKEMKEFRDDVNASIRRISVEFLGATGHIVEGLASSAVDKIFKDAGLDLLHYGKNIKPKLAEDNSKMEVDVLLGNETFVVPVEVKADFTKRKVKRFVRQMAMFRTFFPEYADKEVVAAVAAINYENGTDQLAHEEGLLVIRVSSDDIFSLDPFDVKTLRRF
ncbi:MAG: hypothetical protein IKO62_00015 [Bacteroidales bacterium]|nr:hypothetical protein [Bacteroidales bacterium]